MLQNLKMKTYDLHFSGYKVEQSLINALLSWGFERDLFTNNKRCSTTQFHATYKGSRTINEEFFEEVCDLVRQYPETVADLEFESSSSELKIFFEPLTKGQLAEQNKLPSFELKTCPPDVTKACDIHLAIDVMKSSAYALQILEDMQMISFDRPIEGGYKRIYTLTYEDLAKGQEMFEKLKSLLSQLHLFSGKLKLELLQKQFKIPQNAPVLPLVQ